MVCPTTYGDHKYTRLVGFTGLTIMTDRQTDRPLDSVSSNRPHLASAAMQHKMWHMN